MTPGIVSGLKEKFEQLKQEEYETDELAGQVMVETDSLKDLGHFLAYNAYVHGVFVLDKDFLIDNLNHAKPYEVCDRWEKERMIKYADKGSRWDVELNYIMPNNDSIT